MGPLVPSTCGSNCSPHRAPQIQFMCPETRVLPAALFRMRALTGSMLSTILAALPSHSSTSDCAAHLNDSSKSNKLCQPCAYSSEWKRQRVTLRSAHLRILDRVQKSLEFSMNPHPSAVARYLGMLTNRPMCSALTPGVRVKGGRMIEIPGQRNL